MKADRNVDNYQQTTANIHKHEAPLQTTGGILTNTDERCSSYPPSKSTNYFTYSFDRDELTFPEVVIDDYSSDLAEVMKPLFDTIANAAGWASSQSYDTNGMRRTS